VLGEQGDLRDALPHVPLSPALSCRHFSEMPLMLVITGTFLVSAMKLAALSEKCLQCCILAAL
jgi:hypothetical protein